MTIRRFTNLLAMVGFPVMVGVSGCSSSPDAPAPSYSNSGAQIAPHREAIPAANAPVEPAALPKAAPPVEARFVFAFPTGNPQSSVVTVEQVGPAEARVGMPYTYELRVTNLTGTRLTHVVLHQEQPEAFAPADHAAAGGATQPAAPPAGADKPRIERFEIGDLPPHESRSVQVTGVPTRAGSLQCSTTADYDPPALISDVPVVAPMLVAVAKGPAESDICQDLSYQFTVSNAGTGTAHNVVLHDALPEGLTANGQPTISIDVGDLPPGISKDFTTHLKAAAAGRYVSRASVTSSDAPSVQAAQLTTAVLAPRLSVTLTGPKESYFGQPLTYEVAVSNRGQAPATLAHLKLGVTPGHAEFVDAQSAEGRALPTTPEDGAQEIGTIAPGQTLTATVHFRPQQGGPVTVDATAMANCAEPVTTSASTRIVTVAASSMTITHDPEPVPVGTDVVYHITVQNKGTAPDQKVSVSATLPASEQLVKTSGQTEGKSEGQTINFAPIDVLQPNQTVTWQVEARAMRADDARFTASLTSQSNAKPVVKLEPTTLFGIASGTVTGTSEAVPATGPAAPATQPDIFTK